MFWSSGSGNVAQYTCEKLLDLGAKLVTLSDSSGFIYDEEGVDRDKLEFVMDLKNVRRGRIKEYAEKYPNAVYAETDVTADHNPAVGSQGRLCIPERDPERDQRQRRRKSFEETASTWYSEGANMPTVIEGVNQFIDAGILYGPGKAANAGGVATSGLEMSQNSLRMSWTREEVDSKLHGIMKAVHGACLETAEQFGTAGNYVNGANIAGFLKVADSMLDQGLV